MSVPLDSVAPSVSPRRRRASRRLLSAIHRNNLDLTQKALAQHADLAWSDPSTGWTPLELSALRWRPTIASIILSRMSETQVARLRPQALDLLLEQWPSQSSQAGAAVATLDALLAETSLSFLTGRHPWGWLGYAVDMNQPHLASLLVERGAQVDCLGPGGQGLLHLAADLEAEELVEWCLKQGLSCRQMDESGNTPLHIAAQCGNVSMADRLLQAGGPLGLPNHEGHTPLDLASASGQAGHLWQARLREHRLVSALPPPTPFIYSAVRF